MKVNFRFCASTILLLAAFPFSSITQTIQANSVPRPAENPWNIVVSITQDRQGYMWFAGNGVHRYDGRNVVTYLNNPADPNSLASNSVECVYGDEEGLVWIGMFGLGLDLFDPVTQKFRHFRHQTGNSSSLGNDTVTTITNDHAGNLWIGTHKGLDRLDIKSGSFEHYRYNPDDSTSLSDDDVRKVYVDRAGELWVGTGSPFFDDISLSRNKGGLNRLNVKTGKFTRYLHRDSDSSSLTDNRVRAIYEDSHGTFWIGSAGDGLHVLDRSSGKFTRYRYDPAHPEKLSRPALKKTLPFVDDHITFITGDALGRLWIGTMLGGINIYDPKTGKVTGLGTDQDSTSHGKYIQAWNAFISRDGVLWMSSWQADLVRIDPFHQTYPYTNIGSQIQYMYRESPALTWMSSGNQFIKTDTVNKKTVHYILPSRDGQIRTFLKAYDGKFWLATDPDGLYSFDPQTEKFVSWPLDNVQGTSRNDKSAYTLCEDDEHNLWVGSFVGIARMNLNTGKIIHFQNDPRDTNSVSENFVVSFLQDRNKKIWMGMARGGGVNLFDPVKNTFRRFLKGSDLSVIFQDNAGIIWAGANDGLFRFNEKTGSFSAFVNPESGARFKSVYTITEDSQNSLWVYSLGGIYKISSKNDSVQSYTNDFGITNITNGGPVLNGSKGEVFFSDATGYFDINPLSISENSIAPQVDLTDFKLGELSVNPGSGSVLLSPIWNTAEIHLNYQQNNFSLDFTVLHFSNPEKNQAFYKLENYDNQWRSWEPDHSASYFNMPPGLYIFHIKGGSSNGTWIEKLITIIISPPWWQTWWAYTIFALTFALSIWAFIYYRSAKLRGANRILEEKVKNRTLQLQQSLEDLKAAQSQLVQSEKMASLGQLTAGIAHEIQNPLNFVNNFSEVNEELIQELKIQRSKAEGEKDAALENEILSDIEKNSVKIKLHGRRADAIVKGMLEHSRSGPGVKQLTDINSLIDEYLKLAYHAIKGKDSSFNAELKMEVDKSIGKINIVPQEIGRVLLNVYNNAFHALQISKGLLWKPIVSVQTKRVKDKIEIIVKDNGAGIAPAVIDKIFQPFFTTRPTGSGTGLGLSLSYDIVKAHGGEIRVHSKLGDGSEFVISLPA